MVSNTRIAAARLNTVLAWCHRGLGTVAFVTVAGNCIVLALAQSETTPRHLDDGRQWLDSPASVTASSPTPLAFVPALGPVRPFVPQFRCVGTELP